MLERMYKRQAGFTMLELMVTVSIFAILVSMAVPSFERSMRRTRVDSATNSLVSAFAQARAEAIKRGAIVRICASAEPSINPVCGLPVAANRREGGWIMWADTNGDNAMAASEILQVGEPTSGVSVVAANFTGVNGEVTFTGRGVVGTGIAAPAGTLQIDPNPSSRGDQRRTITLNIVGRTSATVGVVP